MRRIPLFAIQFLFLATLAHAQSARSAMKDFDLFGTWAGNCYQAPGPANEFSIFSLTADDAVELRNDFGPDYGDMVYRILDVKRLSQFRLSLRQMLTTDDRIVLDTVLVRGAGRIRTWSRILPTATLLWRTAWCRRRTGRKPAGKPTVT